MAPPPNSAAAADGNRCHVSSECVTLRARLPRLSGNRYVVRFVMIGKLAILFVAICITIAALDALLWANTVPAFLSLHPHAAASIAPLSIVCVAAGVMLRKNRQRAEQAVASDCGPPPAILVSRSARGPQSLNWAYTPWLERL